MNEFTYEVRISVGAMSPEEGHEILAQALMERIDGWLLAAQRQARVRSIDRGGMSLSDYEQDRLAYMVNDLHDAIQTYDDSTVTSEVEEAGDALYNVAHDLHGLLSRALVRS